MGATTGAGSGAPEACVPRRAPRGLARPRPRPRRVCGTGRLRLALLQSPAGPRCHQAEGCSPGARHEPAARAARAQQPNGCPGVGAPPRVPGGARPPEKVTREGAPPSPGNARSQNATAMDTQSRPAGGKTETGGQRGFSKVSGDPRGRAPGSPSRLFSLK